MKYESWRISFQSSEAAARSAFEELTLRSQQLDLAVKALKLQQAASSIFSIKTIGRNALEKIKQIGGE